MPALVAALDLALAGPVTAQTFTTLYSFTGGSDGASPHRELILSDNTLYGTTYGDGFSSTTAFAVNTDGSGFTTLYDFTGGSDGRDPNGGLILSGNTLYGTAALGGTGGNGTVFAVNTDGTGFTTLHSFAALPASAPYNNSDGAEPQAGLILSGNSLFGTAELGGSSANGTVFKVNTDGTGFTTLYDFTGGTDGGTLEGGLILSGNTLYGTASFGGNSGNGTVYKLNTDGTGFTTLHSFVLGSGSYPHITNSDGAVSPNRLLLSGNTLYGTAYYGGSWGNGTVFKVNTDSTGFGTLHTFKPLSAPYTGTNSDGANPVACLILSGSTLYGTAFNGGSCGNGTVFALNTDGTGFATLYSFTATAPHPGPYLNSDGAHPLAGLVLSGNTLYGTGSSGGSFGGGTVFSLSLPIAPPELTIIPSAGNVILTWPANATGFTLQSTTNLVSPAVWTPVLPGPVVVNGLNAVTNPITGTQQFFRLSQ